MAVISREQQAREWSRLYDKPISEKELTEISDNLSGFFTVLKEWDDKAHKTSEEINDSSRICSNA